MEKTKEKQTTADVSPLLYCSFCGKSQEAVQKILAGPAVCICDECVKKFTKMIPNTFKLPEKQRLVDMFFEGCRRIYMNKMERWPFVWLTTLATLLFQVATLFLLVLVLVMPD